MVAEATVAVALGLLVWTRPASSACSLRRCSVSSATGADSRGGANGTGAEGVAVEAEVGADWGVTRNPAVATVAAGEAPAAAADPPSPFARASEFLLPLPLLPRRKSGMAATHAPVTTSAGSLC